MLRSLFGGKGFPGKVRLARKGQAGDDAASGAAQPQLEGSCDDPGAAGAAQELGDLSLNGGGGGGGGGRRMVRPPPLPACVACVVCMLNTLPVCQTRC